MDYDRPDNHSLGLLASRAVIGLALASHGAQKAFGWFEGPGPEGAAGFMESLGFKPGTAYARASSYTELGAGLAMALGFGGPLAPAATISVMIVAQASVHAKNGFFAQKGGVELGTIYAAAALALASSGYGALSLDRAFGIGERLKHPALAAFALAGGVASALLILGRREQTSPAP